MRSLVRWVGFALLMVAVSLPAVAQTSMGGLVVPAPTAEHKNFKVSVYIPVNVVERMYNDHAWLVSSWKTIASHVKVDKVYIETYRSRNIASAAAIEAVKKFFVDQGVAVAGGIAFSDKDNGQFKSFCYTNAADRAYVKRVIHTLGTPQGGLIARGEAGPDVNLANLEAMYQAFADLGRYER